MADAYSYPLLVELEENKIPKLKNKLVKYFQSKKSGGGDCEVEYQDGSGTAVLRFRKEEDQRNVLAKELHQISLDKCLLKMKVRLLTQEKTTAKTPSDEAGKEKKKLTSKQPDADELDPKDSDQSEAKARDNDPADEEQSSTSAVFENIPDSVNQEFLEMLVENVLKCQDFMLEFIPHIASAVVTFQSGKANTEFIAKCADNRMFTKKNLSIRALEVTKHVLVDDIKHFSDDMLQLYFEKEGGEVEDVTLNETDQTAVITFQDHQAAMEVVKMKHNIKQEEIRVFPFYKSLGVALYGKDKPSPKLPPAVSEPVDGAILMYLSKNQAAAASIRSDLTKHHCNVNLDQSTVCLSPVSSLLKQKESKTLIKDWEDTVKSAFAQSLSKFKSLKFKPEAEQWQECEEKIRLTLENKQVVVVPDKASGVLSVAGLVEDVNRLEGQLSEVMNKIEQRAQRAKLSKTQEIKASPSMFHILSQDGLQDRILQECPELQMSYDKNNLAIKLTGFVDEIIAASKVINDAMFALKRQNLEVDNFVLDLLKDEQQDELTDVLLTSKGINAAIEVCAERVQLAAVSDKDLNDAQDHLSQLLLSHSIDVEDSDVLGKPGWKDLVSQLENANTDSTMKTRIHVSPENVVVCGLKDMVIKASNELDDFLTQNAHVEEAVSVQANVIIEYLKMFNASWPKQHDKVMVSFRENAILLTGSRADVEDCKTEVEDLVSSLFFDTLQVPKPGVKKFFQLHEKMFLNSLKTETGCLVQLVDNVSGKQDDLDYGLVAKPKYQVQTSDGVEIAVCKGDMCSYPVDAVVNAANPSLKLDSGLAGALLRAAGPQLQDECDKVISTKASLKPGDCEITGAGGQLSCKKVIHAVGPIFDPGKAKKAQAQLKRAVKMSLELAERHGCVSVALPAISRTNGFPLNLCTTSIVQAVKEYCDERCEDILKMIHLVDSDDSVVAAMEAAVRTEFGNQGISHPQQAPTPKAAKSAPVKQAASDPSLCRVQTKEGLDIILKQGNIEAAKTDVLVNTIAEDLALNKGAVSNAILGAAGSKLQQLVNNQNATGKHGEVIVTDGCKLKSKQVFHVIAPSWDNGQGKAEKTLRGIFKECLGLAEDTRITSISFPAVGTGNLGFPKDLVASLMLDEILEFSSIKQPKHLKKVVIVLYPGDTQTIQEFSDEFTRRFSGAAAASGASSATSSSKSTGPFSKVVSSSGICETKMGNVTVQVVTGDITQETSDIIVNSSDNKFTLKTGVSKAILDAAGQAVEASCRALGAEPNSGIIMTQPGNLKCKKILHLVGNSDPIKINRIVKDALQMCIDNRYTSVSFPAIGTGQGNAQAKQVADSMLDAVIDVLSQNPSSNLNTVRIIIFQQPMLQDFSTSMQQREGTGQKDKGGFWTNLGSKIKTFFVGDSSDKPQKEEDFVIVPSKVDPACFHICSNAQANVDAAKKWINDQIANEQNSTVITDSAIFNLSHMDIQHIYDIQKNNDVSIRTEIKNENISIIIEGLNRNVIKANRDIHDILKQVRDQQVFRQKVKVTGALVDWQYRRSGLQFQSFDPVANYHLELAFEQSQPDVQITVRGHVYTVDMSKREATNSQGDILHIKRIDRMKDGEVPDHWDPMQPGTTCAAFPVSAGTTEYNNVLTQFQASCKHTITKIERIQNPGLWKSLLIKKDELEVRNGHQNNERQLFHGTSEPTISIINERGFNRSHAGKNAACYGNGSYFAVSASYSASDTYSKPNLNGDKFMYLCRVLTGDFTVGQQGMIAPPAKGSSAIELFDSVVDNLGNPSMFVIFNDIQAYPEYLITFK